MSQKSSWKTRGFPYEVGSIGEKVGKNGWRTKDTTSIFFQDMTGMIAYSARALLWATDDDVRISRLRTQIHRGDREYHPLLIALQFLVWHS